MENINKVICKDCGIEYKENMYYLSRIEGQKRMEICKNCFEDECRIDMLKCFKKYNIPFIKTVWESSHDGTGFGLYMKNISFPQYVHLRWKDSILYNEENKKAEINFYDDIVLNLKNEAIKLNKKLTTIRENLGSENSSQSRSNDMNLYISTLKSLRETLDLINKYDWKLMYSEYETSEEAGRPTKPPVKQIAVWEQNHDNQIKNHKVWNVAEAIDYVAKQIKEAGNSIVESLKNVSENINK